MSEIGRTAGNSARGDSSELHKPASASSGANVGACSSVAFFFFFVFDGHPLPPFCCQKVVEYR